MTWNFQTHNVQKLKNANIYRIHCETCEAHACVTLQLPSFLSRPLLQFVQKIWKLPAEVPCFLQWSEPLDLWVGFWPTFLDQGQFLAM